MNQLTAVWRQANYATQERVKREWKAQGKDPSYHSAAFTTAVEQILIDHLRLLLDEGRVVASGTHEDLLANVPLYSQILAQATTTGEVE